MTAIEWTGGDKWYPTTVLDWALAAFLVLGIAANIAYYYWTTRR